MKLFNNIFYILLIGNILVILPFLIATMIASTATLYGNIRSFVMMTGSMAPIIPIHAMVYIKPMGEYKVGEIIAFQRGSNTIIHRINTIKKIHNTIVYQTKGDANAIIDSQLVTKNNVYGRALLILPYIGSLLFLLKTPLGFFFIVALPISLLFIVETIHIKNDLEKDTAKKLNVYVLGDGRTHYATDEYI